MGAPRGMDRPFGFFHRADSSLLGHGLTVEEMTWINEFTHWPCEIAAGPPRTSGSMPVPDAGRISKDLRPDRCAPADGTKVSG